MEITQFTYFQQMGGMDLHPITVEITYGLERLAMYSQKKNSVFDVEWTKGVTYGQVHKEDERQFSTFNFSMSEPEILRRHFTDYESLGNKLLNENLPLPAYDATMKCSHLFNLLDARGAISVSERTSFIGRIRNLARRVAEIYVAQTMLHQEAVKS
jgi:glycyl-tRNA synthetase alpha chain